MRLPNFLILGANKAGTTALCYYCQQHPEIFFSSIKEPMFFTALQGDGASSKEATLKNPFFSFFLKDYINLFSGVTNEKMVGEGSTSYLANPQCAIWIRKLIPDAKLIAVLRNPIDRALSSYKMFRGNGLENRSFEEAIKHELEMGTGGIPQGQHYLKLGLYASQLKQFCRYFSKEQIYIADYEDFNMDIVVFLSKIFTFLEVDGFVPNDLRRMNTASSHFTIEQDVDLFTINDGLKKEMSNYFQKDISELQTIVDFNVLKWLL